MRDRIVVQVTIHPRLLRYIVTRIQGLFYSLVILFAACRFFVNMFILFL